MSGAGIMMDAPMMALWLFGWILIALVAVLGILVLVKWILRRTRR